MKLNLSSATITLIKGKPLLLENLHPDCIDTKGGWLSIKGEKNGEFLCCDFPIQNVVSFITKTKPVEVLNSSDYYKPVKHVSRDILED